MKKDAGDHGTRRLNAGTAGTSTKTLSLGYSPCPNDTFIFYALVHGKILTEGITCREILEDVETLNQMARRSELDITKASFHAYGHLREQYCLLRSGGALGKGCGPLLVAGENIGIEDLGKKTIAVPGRLTTALLLLRIFGFSSEENIRVMPFDRIIESVKSGRTDFGLIIHESRFTYQRAGLKKVMDLGEWWEEETGLPLPLGGILAKRDLGGPLIGKVGRLIRKSVEYAFSHRAEPLSYIRQHSQEMEEEVIKKHISLYVNSYSLDVSDEGVRAVEELFRRSEEKGIIPRSAQPLFGL
jgi:5,8-dihydroxy-2-naphthoate synthase